MVNTLDKIMHHRGIGIVYLDIKAKVLEANDDANSILSKEKELRKCGDKLVFKSSRMREFFEQILNEVRSNGRTGNLFLKRSLDKPPLKLSIHPVVDSLEFNSGAKAVSLMLLTDTQNESTLDIVSFSEHYGLTSAESELVQSLHYGKTLKQHAEMRGVKITTVRWTLDNVFSKTYTKSQPQLKSLIDKFVL